MPRRPLRATFDDEIAAERAAVTAGAAGCGHTCRCHGGYVCVRTVHDNYGGHWAHPDGRTAAERPEPESDGDGWVYRYENRVSHAGYLADGQLVTWSGPHQTDEEIDAAAAEAAAARQAAVLALLADLDPDTLRAHLGL